MSQNEVEYKKGLMETDRETAERWTREIRGSRNIDFELGGDKAIELNKPVTYIEINPINPNKVILILREKGTDKELHSHVITPNKNNKLCYN